MTFASLHPKPLRYGQRMITFVILNQIKLMESGYEVVHLSVFSRVVTISGLGGRLSNVISK
ncbi:hypothetical protein KAM359_44400 [Aeromonas caviae]|nr:hypothetical protein KAM359_44400 [Aeromonas caviae]GJB48483.1 hypothetical protein KAM370_44250 [Aeromonas caviae]GJB66406.1 hypothetical protein KAM375_44600 [Aeromonas caviae]